MGIGVGETVESSGEKSVFRILKQKCRLPYCIFDVGSNQGQFLELILQNVPSGDYSVHCFEPGKLTYDILLQSAPKNQQIRLNNFWLHKETGEAVLHYDEASSGLASLSKRNLEHFDIDFEISEKADISTINRYCSVNQIKSIQLLTIDIQGNELDALSRTKNMFAAEAIDMVTFEFGGCNTDTRTYFRDFWNFLKKLTLVSSGSRFPGICTP